MPSLSERELAAWRRKIVDTRLRISNDEPPKSARGLWAIVDAIEACIKISGANFDEQMELVDREIEERLTRSRGIKARRIPYLQRIRLVPSRYSIRTDRAGGERSKPSDI